MLLQQVIDLYHSLFLLFTCLSLWLPPFSTQLLFLSSFLPFWGPSELRCSEALRVNWSWPVLHQAGGGGWAGHCSGVPRILILGAEEVQALNMFLPSFLPAIHPYTVLKCSVFQPAVLGNRDHSGKGLSVGHCQLSVSRKPSI